MNTIFGWSRNGAVVLLLLSAIVLVALAGLLLVIASAVGALAVGGVGPVSGSVLLLAVVVLLVANFVLLAILLRCACRSDRKQPQELGSLLPLLFPMVAQLPNALRDIAISLKKTSDAVGWIQGNINGAGEFLDSAGEVAGTFTITVPTVLAHQDDAGFWHFDGVDLQRQYQPLEGITTHLDGAGQGLLAHTGVNGNLDQVKTTLRDTASVVGQMANGLGAAPPTPAEVLQP
jgi:hypothetical protein